MLRTSYAILVAVIATILTSVPVAIIGIFRSTSPVIDRLIRWWARTVVHGAGIELHSENIDAMQPDQKYIVIANHSSYLDIPCLLATIPQPVRFMAKASLFKIPIFGWALSSAGFVPVDRKNRRTAVRSFDQAADRIRRGNSIVIFPEEGRASAREMRPFQRGAFLLALKSELPILPLAIDGTFEVLPVGWGGLKPGPVTVRVGQSFPTAGLTVRSKDALMKKTREQIEGMLQRENRADGQPISVSPDPSLHSS